MNHWFQLHFFAGWTNQFVQIVALKTQAVGPVQPTAEDWRWYAGRVEGFKCPKCGKDERFPRYNHPGKLLGKLYVIKGIF